MEESAYAEGQTELRGGRDGWRGQGIIVPKTWVLVLLWHLGQVLALLGLGESMCV